MIEQCVNVLGINVHKLSMAQVVEYCDRNITLRKPTVLGVVNAAKLVNCREDMELRKSIQEAVLVLADGMPEVWLSRWMGEPLPERVAGIDIMHRLLELADQKHYAVYFLGAKPDVVQKVVDYTRIHHPEARIAGHRDGYFTNEQEAEVAAEIRSSQADILFVAMTSPKKENFQRRYGPVAAIPFNLLC